jgi:hypothetical protein
VSLLEQELQAVNYKKGTLDSQPQVYQLLAQGRWFSPGTPASTTTKTGRHDIAEILLKVALNTKIQISIFSFLCSVLMIMLVCWPLYFHSLSIYCS